MDNIDIPQPYYYDSKNNYIGIHTEEGNVIIYKGYLDIYVVNKNEGALSYLLVGKNNISEGTCTVQAQQIFGSNSLKTLQNIFSKYTFLNNLLGNINRPVQRYLNTLVQYRLQGNNTYYKPYLGQEIYKYIVEQRNLLKIGTIRRKKHEGQYYNVLIVTPQQLQQITQDKYDFNTVLKELKEQGKLLYDSKNQSNKIPIGNIHYYCILVDWVIHLYK